MENNLDKELIAYRRSVHKYPELGNNEFRTTELIIKTLKAHGIQCIRPAKTGVTALVEGLKKNHRGKTKCFALRADIDALPIQENTGKPYASRNPGVMHACGHDANSAIVLGAAIILQRQRGSFSGAVKCIFQPNEETSGGAQQLIKAGVLKNPEPDCIVGIHVSPWLPCGALGIKHGQMMAAVDKFTIEIIGSRGHGAYPHLGKDAIVAASHVIMALQTIVSREIDPVDPVVITVGTISGGEAFNILPGLVRMTGTVRTLSASLHKKAARIIEQKVAAVAKAYGAQYKFEYEILGYPLENSEDAIKLCIDAGKNILGNSSVKIIDKPSMGGEDFAEYLRHVPGCFIFMGAGIKKPYPWHSEKFDINERALIKGAQVLAEAAKIYLDK